MSFLHTTNGCSDPLVCYGLLINAASRFISAPERKGLAPPVTVVRWMVCYLLQSMSSSAPVPCATALFSPLLCFRNTWLNVRWFPHIFYVRGICTTLGKAQGSTKLDQSCTWSSAFFKVNSVLFPVHGAFQSLTLSCAASWSVTTALQGLQSATGAVESPQSLPQLLIPPIPSYRLFVVPRYANLFSIGFLSQQ